MADTPVGVPSRRQFVPGGNKDMAVGVVFEVVVGEGAGEGGEHGRGLCRTARPET